MSATSRRYRIDGLRFASKPSTDELIAKVAELLAVDRGRIDIEGILARSLDARGNRPPTWVHSVGVTVEGAFAGSTAGSVSERKIVRHEIMPATAPMLLRPVVVGAGPAGLFAALRLASYGFHPLVLERGKPVDERARDVARYWSTGELDADSNVQFGEGGAGTFSDGKLTSRTKDFRKRWVLENLVAAGAEPEILFESRPHLGTDRLKVIVAGLRKKLEALGVTFEFNVKVEGLTLRSGKVAGLQTTAGSVDAEAVFLAVGHSSRDLVAGLARQGVALSPKGFAVGVRVELDQSSVDRRQYGRWAKDMKLPAASFAVKSKGVDGRGVYSFCMCPGGVVVPAGSESDGLVLNGMSASKRSGPRANSGLVVTVNPGDFGIGPLDGFEFQRKWEREARELAGDGAVPAQRVIDFLGSKKSKSLTRSSCPWPLAPAELDNCLPGFVADGLRRGFGGLANQLPELAEGVLLGVETRTSSPVRMERDERGRALGIQGLYPLGEGAGYAGGIMSCAMDGARIADYFAEEYGGRIERIEEC